MEHTTMGTPRPLVRFVPVLVGLIALAAGIALGGRYTPRTAPPAEGYYVSHAPLPERLPPVNPTAVGMSPGRLDQIGRLIQRGIAAGGYPGAAVVIGRRGGEVLARGFGHLDWSPRAPLVDPDSTVYDLASLTKVVATTSAIMALYDDGVIRLDDRVSRWVPSFTGGLKDSVTIQQLLTHRSGLPPGRNLVKLLGNPAAARAAVIATPLARGCPPGSCYMYSDLGADLLGFVVEAAAREPLDAFTARRIFQPLEMTETTFHPSQDQLRRLAPTGAPRGRVHDGNAAALGGVAGHAGLFSTASDLAVFAQMLLNGGEYDGVRIFREETVRLFTTRSAGTRALGWDTCDSANVHATCGRYLSARAYGHTGFTGTSLWIDPDRALFMLLLTNRVDDARARRPALVIHDVRADIADAAVLSVLDAEAGTEPGKVTFRADQEQHWQEPVSTRKAKARRGRRRARSRRATPRGRRRDRRRPGG